ncbi:hypothetical protein R3W88_022237 [Solanum pinnatisectum]|uniref:Uncharacterized protein n=1 Tax=Solanum pinnatisectum TaxID=50273 RepID=A0AAV9LU19_9SOLN|nr:hypothetical protein R3W88_022237 [Solanum pinnatisectum]
MHILHILNIQHVQHHLLHCQLLVKEEGAGEVKAQSHTKDHQSWEWPSMPSFKILSTGATKVTRSADITGDIGFKPSTASKFKWKGKSAISTRKLQEINEQQKKKNQKEVVQTIQVNPRSHGKCSIQK